RTARIFSTNLYLRAFDQHSEETAHHLRPDRITRYPDLIRLKANALGTSHNFLTRGLSEDNSADHLKSEQVLQNCEAGNLSNLKSWQLPQQSFTPLECFTHQSTSSKLTPPSTPNR
ncbi:hypothetical protein OAL43_00635, partial [bacterium]|nr:hypothetical protein [bacterium]